MATEILCPDCGASMKKRSSQRGEFYGCSAFPGCRGTRHIDYKAISIATIK